MRSIRGMITEMCIRDNIGPSFFPTILWGIEGGGGLKSCKLTMLNSIHTAISDLNGFIQSDKRCLQTENGHHVGHEGLKVFFRCAEGTFTATCDRCFIQRQSNVQKMKDNNCKRIHLVLMVHYY